MMKFIASGVHFSVAMMKSPWTPPADYLVPNVSHTVAKIVMSYAI